MRLNRGFSSVIGSDKRMIGKEYPGIHHWEEGVSDLREYIVGAAGKK